MALYAYNNPNNNLGQLLNNVIPWGAFAGQVFDAIFTQPILKRTNSGRILPPTTKEDAELQLLEKAVSRDVVFTSTLTNFSIDFIVALQTVAEFDRNDVRVIAFQEEFDSEQLREKVLLASLPMMQKFRRNAFKARRQNRLAGIERAASEGKYKGRQAYSPEDFPNFRELYNSYMYREIGKGEFAQKLGISRPTLDKLLDDFTKKKGH